MVFNGECLGQPLILCIAMVARVVEKVRWETVLYMQLSGAACTFAQDAISPLWVHKRKKGTVIPVQVKSHRYIKCICSYWLASNHWGKFWKTRSFILSEFSWISVMHDNPGDQQGKVMVQHSCKSSCSKWDTSRVKEEINTQEANGSDWRRRGCFPQAARRKEETTNEQTQSFGGREKCKGAEKSINKKNSLWIYCINFKMNKLPIPKTYSTTVQHPSKDLVHPSILI